MDVDKEIKDIERCLRPQEEVSKDYIVVVEITNKDREGNEETRLINLYSATAEECYSNVIQLKTQHANNEKVKIVGTYKRTSFKIEEV